MQDDSDSWLNYLPSALTTLKTVTLLSTSFLCAALAWLGGCLLVFILLSRYFSPAAAHHSRSLYFDYTKAEAVATAHFLPDAQYRQAALSPVSTAPLSMLRLKAQTVTNMHFAHLKYQCRLLLQKLASCLQNSGLMSGWSLQLQKHMDSKAMRSFRWMCQMFCTQSFSQSVSNSMFTIVMQMV